MHWSLHVRCQPDCSSIVPVERQEHGHAAKKRRIEAQPATPSLPAMDVRPASPDGVCPGPWSGQPKAPALSGAGADLAQEAASQRRSSSDGSSDGSGSDGNEESPLLQRGEAAVSFNAQSVSLII